MKRTSKKASNKKNEETPEPRLLGSVDWKR